MEIYHRIGFNTISRPGLESRVASLGVRYKVSPLPGQSGGLVTFDVTESEPAWPIVGQWVADGTVSTMYETYFTPQEIRQAEWSRLDVTHEQGYPQPSPGTLGFIKVSRDNVCPACGAGWIQKAPYRLAKEPHLGRHDFVSPFGTGAVMCTARVINALRAHALTGYDVGDVLIHRTRQPSAVVSQLLFPLVASPGLAEVDKVLADEDGKEMIALAGGEWHAVCPHCGISKYTPHKRGYMHIHRGALRSDTDVVQSYEWFGSGRGAHREVFVSRRFARLILDEGWLGVRLKPLELI